MRLVIDLQGAQGLNSKRGIGRYSRQLAFAMASASRQHEVVVALNGTNLESAEELVRTLRPVISDQQIKVWFAPPSNGGSRAIAKAAQGVRARFLASLQPDLVHVSSVFEGLGDSGVTLSPASLQRLPTVATCYDLIPLIRKAQYLGPGGVLEHHANWYFAGLHEMSNMNGLLAISESSRQEAIHHLGFDAGQTFNIGAGVDSSFRQFAGSETGRHQILRRYGLKQPFVLFVGAGDPRKNETGLVQAFAQLPRTMRETHLLAIVGHLPEEPLRKKFRDLGVPDQPFIVIPFVQEGDLPALYASCALFVFPSLHEGFGLPAAEAMACGAPVIASNNSSMPEVVGLPEALFDATEPSAIATVIERALSDTAFRDRLIANGLVQTEQFHWQSVAERAWDALEVIHDRQPKTERRSSVLKALPTLAFVSPLPPQESGIADYSRTLLPTLSRHYDITLVTENGLASEPLLDAVFPQIDADTFLATAQNFDRILYQIGCSGFHLFQFRQLLPKHPGVVVFHDAFLSNLWQWLAHHEDKPDDFATQLYASHGFPALSSEVQHGREFAVLNYPCCLPIIQQSLSIIQHSQFAADLLISFYGDEVRRRANIIPHLAHNRAGLDRAAARRLLGIDYNEFLVCSFGIVSPLKMPDRVFKAWGELAFSEARLVFVGALTGVIEGFPFQDGDVNGSVTVTGRIDQAQYDIWLAAADVAVQLRSKPRGETSGAITDSLCFGVPVIVNRQGSAAELPENCVEWLPATFTVADLRNAIQKLRDAPEHRSAMSNAGRLYARTVLSPDRIAERFHEVIEATYAAPLADQFGLSSPFLSQHEMDQLSKTHVDDLRAFSRAAGMTFGYGTDRPRLLVDMSELARRDSRSGIQRVVREVGKRLLSGGCGPHHPEAVRFDNGQLRFAREVGARVIGSRVPMFDEDPVDCRASDTLLCVDLNPHMNEAEFEDLRQRKLAGTRIVLVVYDLLPMLRQDFFPPGITVVAAWYTRMLSLVDQAICISRSVADELIAWLPGSPVERDTPLDVDYFHLGSDFQSNDGIGESGPALLSAIACSTRRPTFLITGTLEPRKGYRQVLAGFDRLWTSGVDVGLVIVGKQGWQTEDLAGQLRSHVENGLRLHWLEYLSDIDLRRLYGMCGCLLMASEGEGFGLPIVEAARAGMPILARDIPVFKEIAGEHALYFSGLDGADIADAIKAWLDRRLSGPMPLASRIRTLTWDESVRQFLSKMSTDAVYRRFHFGSGTTNEMIQPAAGSETPAHVADGAPV